MRTTITLDDDLVEKTAGALREAGGLRPLKSSTTPSARSVGARNFGKTPNGRSK
jgi:hypothetical protein